MKCFSIYTYGNPGADTLLFQMVDDHDMEGIEREVSYIKELTGGKDFCLKAVKVESWNKDLSPWKAPAVFGNEDFGDGAQETLEFLLREVISSENSAVRQERSAEYRTGSDSRAELRKIYIGGYSLAGLFALWAGYQTDVFSGIAAASPSIWFPHFSEYMRQNRMQAEAVYLSLGDREERTRNPVMAQVGDAIRDGYAHLTETGVRCILEWNQGNHFKEPDLRTAKAFAWLLDGSK